MKIEGREVFNFVGVSNIYPTISNRILQILLNNAM